MTKSESLRLKRPAHALALLAAGALVIASCGGDSEPSSDTGPSAGGDITISGAWARTSPMSVTVGAVYMDITAASGDQLLGGSVDATIAASVEIHETVASDLPGEEGEDTSMTGDTMSSDTMTSDTMAAGMSGEMTMRPVEFVALPAGQTVKLMPGGYHIMLLDLAAPLEVGQTFEVTLTFANAGPVVVTVEVRDEAP